MRTETVTVTGEAPLLETANADRGMIIDNLRVTELPLNARNPFMLSYLSPGITYNGPAIYQRPFDNGAIADWSINGGQNRNNEFLLDGAPNNSIQGGNNIAYVPPVDAVQEFKIVTNSYDAQYGRTAGGVINVSLKSGTNNLHGSIYEFARRKAFDSNEYFFKLNNREKPNHKLDQYGFQIDGPVRIPGMYDGRNRTFFMFNYEGYKELTPNPVTFTVPDAAQLSGDFSNLRDSRGTAHHDLRSEHGPARKRPVGEGSVPGQSGFPRIASIRSRATLRQYFPQPNQPAPAGSDPWRNNFLFAPNLATDDFHNIATKVDQNISQATRMFFRYAYNKRTETRYTNGLTSGPAQDGQLPLWRINHTGVADWVRVASSTLVFNVRGGLNQYLELARSDPGLGFNPAELGFSPALVNQLPNQVFPRLNFFTRTTGMLPTPTGVEEYRQLGRNSRNRETTTGLSLQPNFTLDQEQPQRPRRPRHADDVVHEREAQQPVRAELRSPVHAAAVQPGRCAQRQRDRVVPARRGQRRRHRQQLLPDAAVGLLRAVVPGRLARHRPPDSQSRRPVGSQHAGLREGEPSELRVRYRHDQSRDGAHPAARARVHGARRSRIRRRRRQSDSTRISSTRTTSSRAWASPITLNDRTIARGGYGLYYVNVVSNSASNGFGVNSFPITSLDGDRTSTYPLTNPFPGGLLEAPGSSLGMETFLGRNPSFSNLDFVNPYVHQFSLGVQRLLPWQTTVELSYVGSRTQGDAEPVGRLQRAGALAARSLRSHQGRVAGVLQRAAAEPVLRRHRLRRDQRGSPARRSRATS